MDAGRAGRARRAEDDEDVGDVMDTTELLDHLAAPTLRGGHGFEELSVSAARAARPATLDLVALHDGDHESAQHELHHSHEDLRIPLAEHLREMAEHHDHIHTAG